MIDTTSEARSLGISREASRRRTFAIISHPDAGKTTLTEKFLLYGGEVHLAGSVTARKHQRATTSDWMELEKQRGISVSSTVLQFEYKDYVVNLLDTPGHRDFSEDTYRVLTAVDAGLGACFFGIPIERIDAYRAAFGVPAQFTPIGAISIGYSDEPPRDLSSRRKPAAQTVHRGRWNQPAR